MSMLISKKDMGSRAAKAAVMAPSIEDRLRQARDLVGSHPVDETAPVSSSMGPAISALTAIDPIYASAATVAGARLEVVSIDLIEANPYNARKIYRPERVSELAASIGAHGQEIPGIATLREGRYVLAAGHYRLRALKVLGAKTMAVMIHLGLSDRDLYAHSYRENAEREAQTALDNALSWRQLLDQGVYASETEIADATGMSLPNVNKTLAALRLSAPVLDVVKEDPKAFALSILYELALYEAAAGQAKSVAMAKQIGAGELSRREIIEARAQLDSPKERKRKETSRQYKIQREGQHIGSLKEWDSGKVALEVVLADPKDRAALVTELRERFSLAD
jgi:ParB family chromosome partitioning protein